MTELGEAERGVTELEASAASERTFFGMSTSMMIARVWVHVGRVEEAVVIVDEELARIEGSGARREAASFIASRARRFSSATRRPKLKRKHPFARPSKSRAANPPSGGSCAPQSASPGCCATAIVATRRTRCSPKSTTGSPRASTPPTSKTPRRCSASCPLKTRMPAAHDTDLPRATVQTRIGATSNCVIGGT